MRATIVNDRIDGTRITVWDVFLYLDEGWPAEQIANVLPLTCEQVRTAIEFIEQNCDYVVEGHRKIEERNARGNPPEIQEKLVQSRSRMRAWLEQRRKVRAGAGDPR